MTADLTISVLAEKLTLKQAMRIHFAGQAMAAIIASDISSNDVMAERAVQAADSLIAELEKMEASK